MGQVLERQILRRPGPGCRGLKRRVLGTPLAVVERGMVGLTVALPGAGTPVLLLLIEFLLIGRPLIGLRPIGMGPIGMGLARLLAPGPSLDSEG